jgi:hypothetical protein
MVIFDLRHDFYQTRTLWQYLIDTLLRRSDASFSYYYLLPFWPIFALAGGFILFRLWKKSKTGVVGVLMIYLVLNFSSRMVNWSAPTGMPGGLNVSDIDLISKEIAIDAKGEYNVAEVLDFDKRAYVLRYFLEYKYGSQPLNVESYPKAKLLYVLAPKDYNFGQSSVWEVYSGGPSKVGLFHNTNDSYGIYKLTRYQ